MYLLTQNNSLFIKKNKLNIIKYIKTCKTKQLRNKAKKYISNNNKYFENK